LTREHKLNNKAIHMRMQYTTKCRANQTIHKNKKKSVGNTEHTHNYKQHQQKKKYNAIKRNKTERKIAKKKTSKQTKSKKKVNIYITNRDQKRWPNQTKRKAIE